MVFLNVEDFSFLNQCRKNVRGMWTSCPRGFIIF